MGFFALTSRGVAADIEVLAAHLSFWVLPRRLLLGRKFFFDVGLRLRACSLQTRRFRIALPFSSDSVIDLSPVVLDKQFNSLIFGRPVQVQDGHVVYDASQLDQSTIDDRVVGISTLASVRDDHGQHSPGFSTWTIELDNPIDIDETVYVRFRFPVENTSRIWFSKGWSFAKSRYIIDLRVADVRESVLLGMGANEVNHIIPIQRLFLFVITPAHFTPQHISPQLHYTRFLEGNVWQHYLATCGSYNRTAKLSIHQWRKKTDHDPITVTNPFIAYMDLMRDAGFETAFYYFAAIIFTGALVNTLHLLSDHVSFKVGGFAALCLVIMKWIETKLR